MAKVVAVNISEKKGEIKHPIGKGYFEAGHGLQGDAHAGNWSRQVSLLGQESIEKMTEAGVEGLCSGKFAENITTKDIELFNLPVGTIVKIGEVTMEVTQIGKKCHGGGCQIYNQVGDCVMPKEGIFTKVIYSGWIKSGDEIKVVDGDA